VSNRESYCRATKREKRKGRKLIKRKRDRKRHVYGGEVMLSSSSQPQVDTWHEGISFILKVPQLI
jgi:hypothetical protein